MMSLKDCLKNNYTLLELLGTVTPLNDPKSFKVET